MRIDYIIVANCLDADSRRLLRIQKPVDKPLRPRSIFYDHSLFRKKFTEPQQHFSTHTNSSRKPGQ